MIIKRDNCLYVDEDTALKLCLAFTAYTEEYLRASLKQKQGTFTLRTKQGGKPETLLTYMGNDEWGLLPQEEK